MDAKRRKRGVLTVFLVIVACACVAAIFYSGYRIYRIRAEYAKGERLYADIREKIEGGNFTAAPGESSVSGTAQASSDGAQASSDGAQASSDGAQAPTDAENGAGVPIVAKSALDFDALREMNGEAVAWIAIPGTKIDYPVVQGEDNVFYLDHLFTGELGSVGAIFMEKTNAPDFSDQNTILFGHHMKDGSMFAGLNKYSSQEYYESHPVMTLYTPGGDYTVEIFAGFAITAQPLPTSFESGETFLGYIADAVAKSSFSSGVTVAPGDRILTLCTCAYVTDDARYILMGVLR